MLIMLFIKAGEKEEYENITPSCTADAFAQMAVEH